MAVRKAKAVCCWLRASRDKKKAIIRHVLMVRLIKAVSAIVCGPQVAGTVPIKAWQTHSGCRLASVKACSVWHSCKHSTTVYTQLGHISCQLVLAGSQAEECTAALA